MLRVFVPVRTLQSGGAVKSTVLLGVQGTPTGPLLEYTIVHRIILSLADSNEEHCHEGCKILFDFYTVLDFRRLKYECHVSHGVFIMCHPFRIHTVSIRPNQSPM